MQRHNLVVDQKICSCGKEIRRVKKFTLSTNEGLKTSFPSLKMATFKSGALFKFWQRKWLEAPAVALNDNTPKLSPTQFPSGDYKSLHTEYCGSLVVNFVTEGYYPHQVMRSVERPSSKELQSQTWFY